MGVRRSASHRRVQTAALVLAGLVTAAAWAQSQPKFPTMPAPPAPAPAPATGGGGTAAPAAPGAPATTPGGPRDPFEPLVKKPDPSEERKVQEVANLKLVGVIWDAKDSGAIRALVETPDGLGYYLRLNEEKFGGKVVAVERDRVRFIVREEVPGAGARERTVELKLSKPDGQ